MTDYADLDAYIAGLELNYSATFVPASQLPPSPWPCINWRIVLGRSGSSATLTTPYRQGVGYIPEWRPSARRTLDQVDQVRLATERGLYTSGMPRQCPTP